LSSPDDGFSPVARLSELREGCGRKVILHGTEIALWRVGGRIYAIGNICSHQHFSLMHEGILDGLTVGCPMHGWSYSLLTGKAVAGNGSVPVFPVRVQDDVVCVSAGEVQ
jgi:nitrite reductase/ring-hydroxylating ferredoxin subunit